MCALLLRPELRQPFLDSPWPKIRPCMVKIRLQKVLCEVDFRSLCDVATTSCHAQPSRPRLSQNKLGGTPLNWIKLAINTLKIENQGKSGCFSDIESSERARTICDCYVMTEGYRNIYQKQARTGTKYFWLRLQTFNKN